MRLGVIATSLLLASSVASIDVEYPKSLKNEKAARKAWGHKCNMLYTFKTNGNAEVLTSTLKEHKKDEKKDETKKGSGSSKEKVKVEPDHGKQKGKTHKRDDKNNKKDKDKKKDDEKNHTQIVAVNCTGPSGDITSTVIDFLLDDGWKKVPAK